MADRTWIHTFTDGRDVSPHAAASDLAGFPAERVATVCGRYYAMDRDQRWERTDRAFRAICLGEGETAADPVEPCVPATPEASPTASSSSRSSRGTSAAQARRRGRLLQLPAGPRTAAVPEARGGRPRPDDDDPLPRRLLLPGGVRRPGGRLHARGGALARRCAPAARGGDGEVRARHLLPERRRGRRSGTGDADPLPLAPRRPDPT